MRRDLLAVVGGCLFLRVPIIVAWRDNPVIWFNRDDEGYALLNFRMLSGSHEPRVSIQDNFWMPRGDPDEVESPPNGRRLRVSYKNGDSLSVEFFDLASAEDLFTRYPTAHEGARFDVQFPVTAVEVSFSVGGTNISFTPSQTTVPGFTLAGGFITNCAGGINLS
jgi:hypothetical protein